MNKFFVKKAKALHKLYTNGVLGDDYAISGASVALTLLPVEVKEDGSFRVMVGTRQDPKGIFDDKKDIEFVFLYNKKGGVIIDSSSLKDCIVSNKKILPFSIDDTYSVMCVDLNLGLLIKHVNSETFLDSLTVLHEDET